MNTLYLRVWAGDETDWITLTPMNPSLHDSELFDQGKCTGFLIPTIDTPQFCRRLIRLMSQFGQFNVIASDE